MLYQLASYALTFSVVFVPPLFVLCGNAHGIWRGAVVAWLATLALSGTVLGPDPEVAPVKRAWLIYGLPTLLLYAALIYGCKWVYRRLRAPSAMPPP